MLISRSGSPLLLINKKYTSLSQRKEKNRLKKQKLLYLFYTWSDNDFKEPIVSWVLPSLHGGSLEITRTVPLWAKIETKSYKVAKLVRCTRIRTVLTWYLPVTVLEWMRMKWQGQFSFSWLDRIHVYPGSHNASQFQPSSSFQPGEHKITKKKIVKKYHFEGLNSLLLHQSLNRRFQPMLTFKSTNTYKLPTYQKIGAYCIVHSAYCIVHSAYCIVHSA